MRAVRREKTQDKADLLDDLIYAADYDRWLKIHFPNGVPFEIQYPQIGADGTLQPESNRLPAEKEISDPRVLDMYFENLGQKRTTSGADVNGEW